LDEGYHRTWKKILMHAIESINSTLRVDLMREIFESESGTFLELELEQEEEG